MEGIVARYLSVFAPFVATVIIAHLIVRSSGSWQLERTGLASPALLRRVLIASTAAIAIILAVDLLTGGDLFLTPSPKSLLLIGSVVLGLVAWDVASRAVDPIARRLLHR